MSALSIARLPSDTDDSILSFATSPQPKSLLPSSVGETPWPTSAFLSTLPRHVYGAAQLFLSSPLPSAFLAFPLVSPLMASRCVACACRHGP